MVGTFGFVSEVTAQDFNSLSKQEQRDLKKEWKSLKAEGYYEMLQNQQALAADLEAVRDLSHSRPEG